MRVTPRDVRVVREPALAHAMYRDQFIGLGYFGSATRANTRLRGLCALGFLRALETPFFAQRIYVATAKAAEIVGERLAPLAASRTGSPRFLQHALSVTNVRIALLAKGAGRWLFEQQASAGFSFQGREYVVRPDGVAVENGIPLPVEVDLGHMGMPKFREKLRAYDAFVRSGESECAWRAPTFTLLVVTTGKARASRLARLLPNPAFTLVVKTFSDIGVPLVGPWS